MFRSVNPGPRLFASEKVRPPILFIVSKSFSRFGQWAHQTNLPKGRPPERVPVPATTCDQQPRRWKSHFANGSRRFSGGAVVLQMGAVVFPAEKSFCKLEQSFFRRRSRFANVSSHLSGGKVTLQMGAVIYPAEKSFCKFADHLTNLQNHFSGGEISLQMGAVAFPPEKSFYKWEQSFFRRRNRFANGSSHFSGGKVTWQIYKMTGLMSKTLKNTLK